MSRTTPMTFAVLAVVLAVATVADAQPLDLPAQAPVFRELPDGCAAITQDVAAWRYQPDAHERALAAIDLEGDGTTFGLLASFEGTSIIIRVRDAQTNRSLGVIKTDTSNTSTVGEIYAYRLARFLGFPEIVAATIPIELRGGALAKIRSLLRGTTYNDANKERNRLAVLRSVEDAIRNDASFTGAFKVWVPAFMFHGGLGHRDRIARQEIAPHIRARGAQPDPSATVTLSQFTQLYSPNGTHQGTANLSQLARDFTNMLLMDALMGQNDRWAGANVHFQSLAGERTESGSRRGLPVWDLGQVRLLALDNGASMRSNTGAGLADIQGNNDPGTRVERFERHVVENTRQLGRMLLGYGCDQAPSAEARAAVLRELGVVDRRAQERAVSYLERTLEYIDSLERRHGDAIYFAHPERAAAP